MKKNIKLLTALFGFMVLNNGYSSLITPEMLRQQMQEERESKIKIAELRSILMPQLNEKIQSISVLFQNSADQSPSLYSEFQKVTTSQLLNTFFQNPNTFDNVQFFCVAESIKDYLENLCRNVKFNTSFFDLRRRIMAFEDCIEKLGKAEEKRRDFFFQEGYFKSLINFPLKKFLDIKPGVELK